MVGGAAEDEGWGTAQGVTDRLVEGVTKSINFCTTLFSLLPFARFALGPGLMGEIKCFPEA